MHPLLILGVSSFFMALILTPLFRNLLKRWGFVDRPDQERKLHATPIPNMGGIPITIAYLGAFGTLALLGRRVLGETVDFSLVLKLFAATGIVLAVGLLDDRFQLQPLHKLLAQLAASALVIFSGVQITGFAGYQFPAWLGMLSTVVWLIACTNAFNLIDGVDGLAAGVGLFAAATTLIAALVQHNVALAAATVPLVGALLGFLRYNFNPATIFLGNSGSYMVGFILGCFGIIWSQKAATILGMTAPLMALSIPILDVVLAVARRFLRRQPIMRGDREHIHHRLLARGFSQRKAVVLLYVMCGVGAGFSLLQSVPNNQYAGAIVLVFCAVAWVGVQNLGYAEFGQARRMILAGGFRRALNSQLELRAFQEALTAAATVDESWTVLRDTARQLGFLAICWRAGVHRFEDEWPDTRENASGEIVWTLRIPLEGDDFINFSRGPSSEPLPLNVNAFAEMVRAALLSRRGVQIREAVAR